MKIRKATGKDLEEFILIDKKQLKDYGKIIGKKIKPSSRKDTIKEFNRILNSKKDILFIVGENPIIAYLHGTIYKNFWKSGGNIEFLYVDHEFRRRGIATKLINEFVKFIKSKNYDEVSLKFNIKNANAEKLYRKLGFETAFITMKRKLK